MGFYCSSAGPRQLSPKGRCRVRIVESCQKPFQGMWTGEDRILSQENQYLGITRKLDSPLSGATMIELPLRAA